MSFKEQIIDLGDGHQLHIYSDGVRIRREEQPMLGGVRFDTKTAQLIVDKLIDSGLVTPPADKLARFFKQCSGRIKSARYHVPEDEEEGIYVVMDEFPFPAATAHRVQEVAEEVFGLDVNVWIEKEVRRE